MTNLLPQLKNFFEKVSHTANFAVSLVFIVFTVILLISFVYGFFFRLKFIIWSIVSFVATIIFSILFAKYAPEYMKKIAEQYDFDSQIADGIYPYAVTLFAGIFYLIANYLVFWPYLAIVKIIRRIFIRKKKLQIKLFRRLFFGGAAGVIALPGALLVANFATAAQKAPEENKRSKLNAFTSIGVKIMTGNKGGSLSFIATVYNVYDDYVNLMNDKSEKNYKEFVTSFVKIMDNPDVRKVTTPIAASMLKQAVNESQFNPKNYDSEAKQKEFLVKASTDAEFKKHKELATAMATDNKEEIQKYATEYLVYELSKTKAVKNIVAQGIKDFKLNKEQLISLSNYLVNALKNAYPKEIPTIFNENKLVSGVLDLSKDSNNSENTSSSNTNNSVSN